MPNPKPTWRERARKLPHHRSRTIVFLLDQVYRLMGWFWGTVVIGGLVVNVILALAQSGQTGLGNPQSYLVVRLVQQNPIASVVTAAVLLALTGLGWLAHDVAHPAKPEALGDTLQTTPVRELALDDLRLKLGPTPNAAYFARDADDRARAAIRAVAKGDDPEHRLGLIVFGPPLVGKSRLAVQALRAEVPDFPLLIWPHGDTAPRPEALAPLAGKPLVLLLDDLQEFASQNEAGRVTEAVEYLRTACQPLVVVATCRAGADRTAVEGAFPALLERLEKLSVLPMEVGSTEAQRFLQTMRDAHAELHAQSFDGTPGSALLDLDRRTQQLRAPGFPPGAAAILTALALLRAASTYTYPEERVRRVAVGVFGLDPSPGAWQAALRSLLSESWLRLTSADAEGQSRLRVPVDAYLDVCVGAIYPLPGRRAEDDFPALHRALASPPPDSDALFHLAEALRLDPRGDKAAQMELALQCVQDGLAALDSASPRAEERELWASGQLTLGNSYGDRMRGDAAENQEAAIAAFEAALTVRTRQA